MSIKKVFDKHCSHLKVDDAFYLRFFKYVNAIYTKDPDHVQFMGSTLLGVYRVQYTKPEINFLWDSLVEVDKSELEADLWDLSTVDKRWKVGGNATNHMLIYLLHLTLNSKLKEAHIEKLSLEILKLLMFKFMTSWLSEDFRYLANKDIATTAYNTINRTYLIKRVDSWGQFFIEKGMHMMEGTNQRKDMRGMIKSYNHDKTIVGVITGISSNLNDTRVSYNRVYHAIKDGGNILTTSSGFGKDSDGGKLLKDVIDNPIKYTNLITSKIILKEEFIDQKLLGILLNPTAIPEPIFLKVLEYLSDNFGQRKMDHVEEFVNTTMAFGMQTLNNANVSLDNLGGVNHTLRGAVTSRVKDDPVLEKFKSLGNDLVKVAVGKRSDLETIRNTTLYYLVLWSLLHA